MHKAHERIKLNVISREQYNRENPNNMIDIHDRGAYAFLGVMLILMGVTTTVISTVIGKTITTGVVIGWLVFKIIPCIAGVIYIWLAVKDYK